MRIFKCRQVVSTHTGESAEINNVKIMWDFSVQNDCKLEHNKPDILILDKNGI